MARKKNIHPDYKEVKFSFLNSDMEPIFIRSALKNNEKTLPKSITTHEAWQKNRAKTKFVHTVKDRFNIDL
jgi:ribosomal protein L31